MHWYRHTATYGDSRDGVGEPAPRIFKAKSDKLAIKKINAENELFKRVGGCIVLNSESLERGTVRVVVDKSGAAVIAFTKKYEISLQTKKEVGNNGNAQRNTSRR